MKRDMDLVRIILLKLESLDFPENGFFDVGGENLQIDGYQPSAIHFHLALLYNGGFYEADKQNWRNFRMLTWDATEFLESVRDEEIWRRTKAGALGAGGFTVDLLKDLAKGFIRKKIQELTDIAL